MAWNVLLAFLHFNCLPIQGGLPAGADQYFFHGMSGKTGGDNDSLLTAGCNKMLDFFLEHRLTIQVLH